MSVSVLMPVYNGVKNGQIRFLEKAINSVLAQDFADFEFVIVDDGSDDGTDVVIQQVGDPRIRLLQMTRNSGIVDALNFGLEHCSFPLVARHDADDYSAPERLRAQLDFFDANPFVVACGTHWHLVDENEQVIDRRENWPCSPIEVRAALKHTCAIAHGSVMYNRDVILSEGGYSANPEHRHVEDYELWVRLAAKHDLANLPEPPLYFHRVHDQKIGSLYSQEQAIAVPKIMQKARSTL